jgi:ribosomal protein L7Ae-like RNA K-turn-binding protein
MKNVRERFNFLFEVKRGEDRNETVGDIQQLAEEVLAKDMDPTEALRFIIELCKRTKTDEIDEWDD